MIHISYSLSNGSIGTENVAKVSKSIIFYSPCSVGDECTSYTVKFHPGKYRIESWGSVGGSLTSQIKHGLGGYVKGEILFEQETTLFLYIGFTGYFNTRFWTYSRGVNGGGGSDVRTKGGLWSDFESLKSRILVAGGGGGAEWSKSIGGNGGSLVGHTGFGAAPDTGSDAQESIFCQGGTQISGGVAAKNVIFHSAITRNGFDGGFGYSGYNPESTDFGGNGGGGYYGGSSMDYAGAGGGGSSFISGQNGCDAILENSTIDNIVHTGQSVHYSHHLFSNTDIIDGNETMPLPDGSYGIGNRNYGAIRITEIYQFITSKFHTQCTIWNHISFISYIIIPIIIHK